MSIYSLKKGMGIFSYRKLFKRVYTPYTMITSQIIVDTREQRPLWDPKYLEVKAQKLDEGDYTTEDLYGIAHIERKSGIDLYGSIIQGHKRFTAELQRAMDKNIELAVFVECPEEMFYRKLFPGGYRVKAPTSTLRKIIPTMAKKYNIEFVWCEDREDMKTRSIKWFNEKRKKYFKKVPNKE